MKKLSAILLALCLMASMLSVSAITAMADDAAVMRVSGMLEDGTTVLSESYTSFADGWNRAAKLAQNQTWMEENKLTYVVVDLLADWTANEKGEFGSGDGFRENTIRVPGETKIMLNMHGHTINRGKTSAEDEGEVIFMGKHAELIINGGKNGDEIIETGKEPGDVQPGTITGGYSKTGAGGIHLDGYNKLTLNNVNITGNNTKNDDGAGIAAYNESEIVMNGGCLSNNVVRSGILNCWGGGMYLNNSTATLNGVLISGNEAYEGAAMFVRNNSKATLNNCIVEKNGTNDEIGQSYDIFRLHSSELHINGGEFRSNGGNKSNSARVSSMFHIYKSNINITGGEEKVKFTKNATISIFESDLSESITCYATNCEFTDNDGMVGLYYPGSMSNDSGAKVIYSYTNCTFNNNNVADLVGYDLYGHEGLTTILDGCDFGDSVIACPEHIIFRNYDAPEDFFVMRVTALKNDGTVFVPEMTDHTSFSIGWVAAATMAKDSDFLKENDIDRIVVDLLADWIAEGTSFGSGEGFSDGAICVPQDTTFTINLNGHTIDRGLDDWYNNGEVLYIRDNADVIINGGKSGDPIIEIGKDPGTSLMGTITGGNSGNGAGGIHIDKNANVTLNNVRVDGNVADDDHGSAIALHDGSVLTMNGGSISHNKLDGKTDYSFCGGVYVYKAEASFNHVEFKDNQSFKSVNNGVALYIYQGTASLENCLFEGNALDQGPDIKDYPAHSVVHLNDATMTAKKCTFTNNGTQYSEAGMSAIITTYQTSSFLLDECIFENNSVEFLLNTNPTIFKYNSFEVYNSTFINNVSGVLAGTFVSGLFENCIFNNNVNEDKDSAFKHSDNCELLIRGGDIGDSSFDEDSPVKFEDPDVETEYPVDNPGSIFGDGSVSMIVALLALTASAFAIGLTVASNKKKAAPAAANKQD